MEIFALFMLLGFFLSWLIPETKGKTLEELSGENDEDELRRKFKGKSTEGKKEARRADGSSTADEIGRSQSAELVESAIRAGVSSVYGGIYGFR